MLRLLVCVAGIGYLAGCGGPQSSVWGPNPGCAISGTVVDADTDQPVVGATIVAGTGNAAKTFTTDDNGHFRIDPVPDDTTKITVYYADITADQPLKSTCSTLRIKLPTTAAGGDTITLSPQ